MATSLRQIQTQKQKLAPRQVLQARLLQLNTVNLEQTILEELEENPLLEQVESEEQEEVEEETAIDDMDVSLEDMYSDESTYYLSEEKKDMPLPDQHTLIEDLIDQLQDSEMNDRDREIAEEILWNTNERGYLDTDLILIADRYELLEEEIIPILKKIQRLEPKGIGSRNLEECLMIQLEDEEGSLPHEIVHNYFDDFMHKRYDKIRDRLDCTEAELHDAVEHISHLNPRPGEGYSDKFQTVIPDVIIREDGDDWVITTNDGGLPELRISQDYEEQLKNGSFKGEAKKFIKEKMDSANWFIEAVHQRRITMVNVMRSIIVFQPEWFAGNMDFLRPLKLQDVADKIKMDISTISRSTRGKFVDTPYGIFELKHYFTDSIELSEGRILGTFIIKRALEKIINTEDKHKPLNDDVLVVELEKQGYTLARRTVAKYRDHMGYPVARLRKEI
ncbi:MAG: RNA polymerase factor sigma-54 [Candidatus Marinimicrobia bacterium]|nr:RNA polymerase factor sigma-54 [Candidatus Neomarinimicrobiota bacterium]MBT4155651.1 RNA polymerase factor sigma-54 [Candidatus Neomarinimicrobiota bacterium]MBT4752059.1 RNA polymerase factor sigma-54 [Candidatus Neomarinimicrobiota bacterium]MBT6413337.1 RNA polymerase factor sigma-54 [Candidatus Neomarinimicrobiota bacterium]MBT7515577.1 RNA polymerase factor sigma-54 [Candidatus Neomarinimicrobiota bacterium]